MKTKIPNSDKKLSFPIRLLYFIVGMVLATAIIIYGVTWANPIFDLSVVGVSVNTWITAAFIVLIGIFAGTLIKSAILGKNRLD